MPVWEKNWQITTVLHKGKTIPLVTQDETIPFQNKQTSVVGLGNFKSADMVTEIFVLKNKTFFELVKWKEKLRTNSASELPLIR